MTINEFSDLAVLMVNTRALLILATCQLASGIE